MQAAEDSGAEEVRSPGKPCKGHSRLTVATSTEKAAPHRRATSQGCRPKAPAATEDRALLGSTAHVPGPRVRAPGSRRRIGLPTALGFDFAFRDVTHFCPKDTMSSSPPCPEATGRVQKQCRPSLPPVPFHALPSQVSTVCALALQCEEVPGAESALPRLLPPPPPGQPRPPVSAGAEVAAAGQCGCRGGVRLPSGPLRLPRGPRIGQPSPPSVSPASALTRFPPSRPGAPPSRWSPS